MEIKRIFNRNTCLILLLIVVANLLFYYVSYKDDIKQEEYFQGMIEHYDGDILEAVREFYHQTTDDIKNNAEYRKLYSAAKSRLEQRVRYIEGYNAYITNKINHANLLLGINLFDDISSYEEKNLHKSISDLNKIKDITPVVDDSKAFDTIFEHNIISYFLLLMVFVTVFRLVKEKKDNITPLVFSTPKGRLHLIAIRGVTLFAASIIYSFVLYFSTLLLGAAMFKSFGGLSNPLQSSEYFCTTIFTGSRIEFLIYFAFSAAMLVFFVGMTLWAFMNAFASYQIGVTIFFILFAAEMALYILVSPISIVRFLHFINLFQLVDYSKAIALYQNWGYAGFVLSSSKTLLLLGMITAVTATSVVIFTGVKCHPVRGVSKIENFFDMIGDIKRKVITKLPNCLKELYKSLFLQRAAIFFIVMMVLILNNRLEPRYISFDEGTRGSSFYNRFKGMTWSDELEKMVQSYEQKYEELKDSSENTPEKNLYFQLSTMSRQQADYLKSLKERGIDGQIINQSAYEAILGSEIQSNQELYSLIALSTIVMMTFGIFSYEKRCSMDELITSASNRKKVSLIKLCISVIYAITVFAVVYGVNAFDIAAGYAPDCLDAPVQSIHQLNAFPLRITIGQYFLLIALFRLTVMIAVVLAVILISKHTSYLQALGLSAMLFVFPHILYICGVDMIKYMDIGYALTKFPVL